MASVVIEATPDPPYYAAVITVERTESDDGYFEMADAMYQLATTQPGFLGMEWVYDAGQRAGITSSYWTSADAIAAWKQHVEHLVAQRLGQERWYRAYTVRIARVERDYTWSARAIGHLDAISGPNRRGDAIPQPQ
jgi:heme-degrading monooxygenase HmoA